MSFSILRFFRKKSAEQESSAPVVPERLPEKTGAARLSKTVMPSSSRAVVEDPFRTSTNLGAAGPAAIATAPSPAVTMPQSVTPRTVSFGGNTAVAAPPKPAPATPPPARSTPAPFNMGRTTVAAPAPSTAQRTERTISVELGDLISQLRPGSVDVDRVDPTRLVSLRAAEIEKGMSNGRPAVSLASLYEQVPEIFQAAPAPGQEVTLPFSKVLEQFAAFQVRRDQQQDDAVPQVETPFLKAAIEDGERFGTPTSQLHGSEIPPVRVEPATAKTIAAAEPEPALADAPEADPAPTVPKRISLPSQTAPAQPAAGSSPATPVSINAPPAPVRIPFRLSSNGTGAPASECVPASSGPSVPTPPPLAAPPTRIPFKIASPSAGTGVTAPTRVPSEPFEPASRKSAEMDQSPAGSGDTSIVLGLRCILQNLPAFQLAGDPDEVPEDVVIELPFSIIQPQLALGRVSVSPKQFEEALPEDYAHVFDPNEANTPVSLPLSEVLQNLPGTSLRMREDQEELEVGAGFDTPFSRTAEEDAKRLNVAAAPIPKPEVAPAAPVEEEPTAEPQTATERTLLQQIFDTDDENLDAKAVAALAAGMPGVNGCAVMFSDGLSLAGNLPPEFEAEGLCAMAPSLVQRVSSHLAETKLGELQSVTLSCDKSPITFFMHDNICLAALHDHEIGWAVRDRLAQAVRELSRMYSQPA